MASSFKTLTPNDKSSTKTLLHEAIPLTGTLVSGTYADLNIKTYSHGMFQSVFDYPFLSSSANHIFDLTAGYPANSPLSGTEATTVQQSKKNNVYNQMAQVLSGFDATGTVQQFDADGNFAAGGTKYQNVFFINFARLLAKDEIQKGTFSLSVYASGTYVAPTDAKVITDAGAATSFKVNSPAGEYGLLKDDNSENVGLLFYQAGVAVLTASIFGKDNTGANAGGKTFDANGRTLSASLTGSSIGDISDGVRARWNNCSFNNTTELNSTIYFCRAMNSDFNYSSNPTYTTNSKVFVKDDPDDLPTSYITTVGLYSPDNELLAVAKLSEPIKKTPANELTLRVRLDY
jgi:hypothetical protein